MKLAGLIRGKRAPTEVATVTLATPATHRAQASPTVAKVAAVAVATLAEPRVDELRRLLTLLLWDDPQGVEPEIKRTLADDALEEALVMYRRLVADYKRLGELPGGTNHSIGGNRR